ncbi:MAG: methylated-DNA--[protein]-cysteine S-methyltransferase [Bacteriovoracaceae bacterium]|jgi:AraC family transcriptional regulator, regulatory protein of adaptative response / methylated-DNA-[protein]-cysteine methyltransferase|nr:methylated-DNA--[protein]-cysteine S-methyltransferase [Bacteriovoracaceae bacterium]
MNLTFEQKYNAIGKKESLYEGIFVTAVKSTKIFCRPSCRARKPLAKNVTFYKNAEEALRYGYRPCKICKPMENESETPGYIKELIKELHRNPYQKIKDWNLKKRNLEPSHVRRWFKKHHNMTFHAYQRLIRINSAYTKIQEGDSITLTAFDSGYESLSGFNDGYKNIFGSSPQKNPGKTIIYIDRFSTKLGAMYACSTDKGICLLEFTDRKMLETEFKNICSRFDAVIIPGTNKHIKLVKKELKHYLEGKLKKFTVPLDTAGTDFQKSVWKILKSIPYGKTCSYLEQAKKMNNPKAVRAVANANGMNSIAIIIPCHRVIGSDGSLTGYGGGLPRKKWLLELEQSQKNK